jgi:hypothetical protein
MLCVMCGRYAAATRHARRVYVGGLPPSANEATVATFFSNALAAVGGAQPVPGEPVLNVYMNQEKKFAFVEFRTVEVGLSCHHSRLSDWLHRPAVITPGCQIGLRTQILAVINRCFDCKITW